MPLNVQQQGAGPFVVLLHGAPTTPEHLEPLADRLARTRRVLIIHLPGYGESPALEPYDLDKSHALVEEAVVACGAGACDLVGFSGGAYRALALACRGVLTVRRVVSLAGLAELQDAEKAEYGALAEQIRAGLDMRAAAPAVMPARMLSPRGREDPRAVEEVIGWAAATPPLALAAELEALAKAPDLRPELAKLSIPVLARVGELDATARSERLVAAAKHGTLQRVPEVGHALLLEDFVATAQAVVDVLG